MNETNGLAVRSVRQIGLVPTTMTEAADLAKMAASSGLVNVQRVEDAMVILLTGMELGLSPMQSFRGIYVVNGKPVLSADMLVAIVRASPLCAAWRTVESTPERCTIETRRTGDEEKTSKTWTMKDADRAGLALSLIHI